MYMYKHHLDPGLEEFSNSSWESNFHYVQGFLKVEIASSHFGYSLKKSVAKCISNNLVVGNEMHDYMYVYHISREHDFTVQYVLYMYTCILYISSQIYLQLPRCDRW